MEDSTGNQHTAAADIERFRLSCEAVEQAARKEAVWDEDTVEQLEEYLKSKAIVSCGG